VFLGLIVTLPLPVSINLDSQVAVIRPSWVGLGVGPGFASRDGDTGGAPSPSGRFMAFTNNASGTAYVMRSNVDGTRRHRLAVGNQPDWAAQPQR
jgi:hypothetical protein